MFIAILSDIHDNLVNLQRCTKICNKQNIDNAICCGDVTNNRTLHILSIKFKKLYLVKGNAEIYNEENLEKYSNINYAGKIGFWDIKNKQVGVCHEPYLIDKVIEKRKNDIIFYGHTHKPWEMKKKNTKIINPGTLSGMFQRATFAIWNTENNNMELKIL